MRKRRGGGRKGKRPGKRKGGNVAFSCAVPPMCPHCSLARPATYVSTFGALLCRADAALQLQGRCSGQLPWSETCSSMQRIKKETSVTFGNGGPNG